jgi:hypothetical protein
VIFFEETEGQAGVPITSLWKYTNPSRICEAFLKIWVHRSLFNNLMLRCAHLVIMAVPLLMKVLTVSSYSSFRVINSSSIANSGEVERVHFISFLVFFSVLVII